MVRLESWSLWECWVPLILPLLPSPFWSSVEALDRILSMDHIELFDLLNCMQTIDLFWIELLEIEVFDYSIYAHIALWVDDLHSPAGLEPRFVPYFPFPQTPTRIHHRIIDLVSSPVWCVSETNIQYWKIPVSSKTNFGCNTNSARFIIFDGFYHFSL